MPVEPPGPSTERLAAWQALIERIGQGDRSQVLAWQEVAAARSVGAYQVFLTRGSTSGSAAPRPCWSARSLASSPFYGWIPPRPA
jgi:hypothetical protein